MNPIVAFDFSCNKPAACILVNGKYHYYAWPSNIDKVSEQKLKTCDVNVTDRRLPPLSKKDTDSTSLIIEHVTRAKSLADAIIGDVTTLLKDNGITDYSTVTVANEGFSFASNGDATLDLAGYKYILMDKLITAGFTNLKTYAPITIKSTAGCARKGMGKAEMIAATGTCPDCHRFNRAIADSSYMLKKKTAYVQCVDDLADAYWCLRTAIKKEKLE